MENPPILLLHGLGTSSERTWRDNGWIDLLGDTGRTVVALDLPGHGTAPKAHDPAAYDDFEADVARRLDDAVGDQVVDAVGFSLGARTLLHLAADRPDRFGRLVVAGVGANLFRAGDESSGLADLIEGDTAPAEPTAAYFHRTSRTDGNDPKALAAFLRRTGAPRLTDEALARIHSPVLIVLGDGDFAGPAEPLADRLTSATVEVRELARTDHFATPKSFAFLDAALVFLGANP
jgi:pimeloyl-ACP methyl ester carboxylesterase